MTPSPVAIASDHAGFALKSALIGELERLGRAPIDLGARDERSVDYPDFADALADALAGGRAAIGVLICGTGIGISIAANRHRHIRAALCSHSSDARLSREHNDANVLALGARTTGLAVAIDCLEVFLATPFEGGRHQRRVDKLGSERT